MATRVIRSRVALASRCLASCSTASACSAAPALALAVACWSVLHTAPVALSISCGVAWTAATQRAARNATQHSRAAKSIPRAWQTQPRAEARAKPNSPYSPAFLLGRAGEGGRDIVRKYNTCPRLGRNRNRTRGQPRPPVAAHRVPRWSACGVPPRSLHPARARVANRTLP